MSDAQLVGIAASEVNDLYRLMNDKLLPRALFFAELARVRNAIDTGTCRRLDAWRYGRRVKAPRAPTAPRAPIHCRDRTDNNVNIVLRRFGVAWNAMKPLSTKRKMRIIQEKMRMCGLCGAEFKPLLDFEIDETSRRQEYGNEVKAVLKWLAEEEMELFVRRVEVAARARREQAAASALLAL